MHRIKVFLAGILDSESEKMQAFKRRDRTFFRHCVAAIDVRHELITVTGLAFIQHQLPLRLTERCLRLYGYRPIRMPVFSSLQ